MICALDYETSGLDFYAPGFEVISASFAFPDKPTEFIQGQQLVGDRLTQLISLGYEFVVHNAQFEWGVTKCVYGVNLPIKADTKRLAQNYGAPSIPGKDRPTFRLMALVKEYLGIEDYKKPYYDWLREAGYQDPGANLSKLPLNLLEEYNNKDAEYTLQIYQLITDFFKNINHSWEFDHTLFLRGNQAITGAQIRGVAVDRDLLQKNIERQSQVISTLSQNFIDKYKKECQEIVEETICKKWKTEKRRQQARQSNEIVFNPNSGPQLERLFIQKLGLTPKFLTPTGRASTKSAHLSSYGEGGEMLSNLGSNRLYLIQMQNLLEASKHDGRWHPSYQLVRTATGRLAGGGGEEGTIGPRLNPQGLARRFKPLMECVVADPGHTFVSMDLSAGEPTVISHYTKDPNYYAATFGMVGKKPYYNENILMISDIYFMGASVSPTGKHLIHHLYNDEVFDDWVDDEEKVKNHLELKPLRKSHKGQILGMGYEMGPKKLVEQAYDQGYVVKLEDAKEFHRAYWHVLFPKIYQTKKALQRKFQEEGYLVNRFGFLLRPDSPHKCFNYMIQSIVSGIIYALLYLALEEIPDLKCEGIIHDELILQIPTEKLSEYRKIIMDCVKDLNTQLAWDVDIRVGWKEGSNFYEAK